MGARGSPAARAARESGGDRYTPRMAIAVHGSRVTFTVRVMGNAAAPTGTVSFTANGNTIAGCGAVAVSGSQALC